jgi:hypothetical protein
MAYKDIPGYPDYTIDSDGNVVSYRVTTKGRMLTNYVTKQGSKIVAIGGTTKTVSSLVMLTFGTQCPGEGYEVYHKDRNKLNTNINNLAWGDRKEIYPETFVTPEGRASRSVKMKEHWRSGRMKQAAITRRENIEIRNANKTKT